MSLTTYLSPVVTWSVAIAVGVAIIPPMYQGFVVGGGSNLIEQASQELSSLFSWAAPSSALVQPLQGDMVMSSPYGMRKHPVTGAQSFHNGKDYQCTSGQPVLAVAAGVINHAGTAGNAGLLVAVDHANGLQSLYMHLDSTQSMPGAQVRAGDVIGTCGNTGRSTGAHLHLSLKQGGEFIDPTTKGL